jgi:ribosome biogenesis protein UTP30
MTSKAKTKNKAKATANLPDEIIDGHVSKNQCSLAVNSLLKHAHAVKQRRDETQLLGAREEEVWLVVASKRMCPEKKLKPIKIPLKYPIVDPRTTSICLITKDPQREYKDLLEEHNVKFISRVVGIEKLKGKFKPFEARRQLLRSNGLFLADERIIPLLPKLLGKMWFDAKKNNHSQ